MNTVQYVDQARRVGDVLPRVVVVVSRGMSSGQVGRVAKLRSRAGRVRARGLGSGGRGGTGEVQEQQSIFSADMRGLCATGMVSDKVC